MNARLFFWVAGAALAGVAAWRLVDTSSRMPVAVPVAARAAPSPALAQPRWLDATPAIATPVPDPGNPAAPATSPVYGRNGRAVDLGGLGVAAFVASRIAAARSGDAHAAYAVYQATSICAAIEDPLPEFGDASQRDQVVADRASVAKLCMGMTPAQIQERLGFLARAARAGNPAAQIDFYMEGPYGRAFDMEHSATDPTVVQWKQDALGYLKDAGNKCDHFAFALLSNVYDAGLLTERDAAASMAYSIAAAVPRNKVLSEAQLRERFGADLPAAQFAAARQQGAMLAEQACGAP